MTVSTKDFAAGHAQKRWPFLLLALVLSVLAVLTSGFSAGTAYSEYSVIKGKVLSASDAALSPDPFIDGLRIGKQPVMIELAGGPHRGAQFEVTNMLSRAFNIDCRAGMTILCNVREENGAITGIDIFGYSREGALYGLAAAFVLILLLVGRKNGLYSLIALAFTLVIVVFFMIPRILEGNSPIFIAMVTAAVTTAVSIFIIGGWSKKSLAAIAGILGGVSAAGAISCAAGTLGHLSGLHIEQAQEMISLARDMPLKVPELLFAGIIISSLGAIMDVGMSISSSVFEVRAANETLSARDLYRSGMNVGRDVMGTMTNTLILAFAGSSVSVLIIILLYKLPYIRMINLDILGIELLQGLSGSVGLVLAVPVTAACAAALAAGGGAKPAAQAQNAKRGKKV